jgi:LPS export ABC transporter permease LptG/LPS export ABC transporter permease LptF
VLRLRLLDRYVLSETFGPLVLGFSLYTFILLIRFLFQSAEMIIRRGVPLPVVGELLLTTLPNIVVLTLPMSLLFAILTAVGRLASDSELVALRACGVSLAALYRPILLLSAALALLNTTLMLRALPWGNSALQRLRLEIAASSVARQVEPRVFYEEWEGKVLYVFDLDRETDRWRGVFLAQSLPTHETEVTVAAWGQVRVDPRGERVILMLGEAVTHKVDLNDPTRYQRHEYSTLDVVLDESYTSSRRAKLSASRGVRELTLSELRQRLADPQLTGEQRNVTRVEIHKKFAIPGACLVFGLFALPLGFNNRSGGRASGFALSIAVILLYYVLLNNGEEAARFGHLPAWLGMWLPNLLLSAAGLFLLTRRNRDQSLLVARLDRWLRHDFWRGLVQLARWRRVARRRAATEAEGPGVRVRISRPRLRFPNLLDRYTLRLFYGVFALVLLSGVTISVVADLTQRFDEILKNHVPRSTILAYYSFLTPQIFHELLPIVILVATLITFGLLSKTSEITAVKAAGTSLYRLSAPVVAAAALFSLLSAGLQAEVLPVTNQRAQQLADRIQGVEAPRTYRRADRWLFGQGGYIYHFLHYDPRAQALQRLQVFEFDGEHRLRRRIYATDAYFGSALPGGPRRWLFSDGWVRRFSTDGGGDQEYSAFAGPVQVDFRESPDFFASELRRPEQMGYRELRRYVGELRRSGQQVPELEVSLYNKAAFPATALVMALVALPFAFRLGRQGTLYGIGLSIALGMVFFAVLATFTKLGEAGVLPPAAAVWSPSAIFATLAVYLFLGVRT